MSDATYSTAYLSTEQKDELELLEMKSCLTLLDDQIIQLRRFRDVALSDGISLRSDEYEALMASVAHATALARKLNARATQTISESAVPAPVRMH